DEKRGRGDGKLKKKQLFTCKKDHAVFVDIKAILPETDLSHGIPGEVVTTTTTDEHVALSIAGESKTLQENLSQKESLEGRLPYVEQIWRAKCEKLDLEERLTRMEQLMTYYKERLPIRVSIERKRCQEQLKEYKRQLRDSESKLDNVETQLSELQEQFTILEERKERETFNLQDELEIKRKELNELQRELRDREQYIVQLKRDLLDRETKLDNFQTQLIELQEKFTILKEQEGGKYIVQQKRDLIDRETKIFREDVQTQLRELQEKCTILEEYKLKEKENCNLQDEVQDIVELKTDLKEAKETKSKYELQLKTRDWILSRDEVELTDKRLGEGAFGIVFEGRYCDCPVAVKKLKEYNLTPEARSLFEREMDIASRCRHPCLLLFIGATIDEGPPLLVTELMELSLRDLLRKRQLSETQVSVISLDVARALEYLHQRKPTPIVHRDVSSANVLLWKQNDQWRAKLSDYGTPKFVAEIMTENPGASIYAAPEAGSSDYQTEIDVYSFGVLLTEMCLKNEAPDPNRREEQVRSVKNEGFGMIILWCIEHNPEDRPTMTEVIKELKQLSCM
ncbi:unnamed protein product, partial [Porites evermanni]